MNTTIRSLRWLLVLALMLIVMSLLYCSGVGSQGAVSTPPAQPPAGSPPPGPGGNPPPPPAPPPPPPPVTPPAGPSAVVTVHGDNARTGQKLDEIILTPANVNSASFGRLFSYSVDGHIHAQPLYLPGVNIGGATHNVVYVATEHGSVFAFDADSDLGAPLWRMTFVDPAHSITAVPVADANAAIFPEFSITGTPVIDVQSGTLYVSVETKESGVYVHRLHALDISTGAEKFGGPVEITATVPGTGAGTLNGNIKFVPLNENQRAGLLLHNNILYIAFGSHNDTGPYHGWIMAYDATTLRQIAVWMATPSGIGGGVWQSGIGLSVDAAGDLYAVTGNGTFNVDKGGSDFSNSFVKLRLAGNAFQVVDWFAPFNALDLNAFDRDLGSFGVVILPDQPGPHPHLTLGAGKDGTIYVIDRDNMGHKHAADDNQIVQVIRNAIGTTPALRNYSSATVWKDNVYLIGAVDTLNQYKLTNGLLSTTPVSRSGNVFGPRGATACISANGDSNAILWIQDRSGTAPVILRAYDASDVSKELYNSTQAGNRDAMGPGLNFALPTIANGKVYVGTQGKLNVFGLLK